MGTLTRTISAKTSSASGYWTQNSERVFSVDLTDSGAIAGATVSSASLTLSNIKAYSSDNTYWEVYFVSGTRLARAATALVSNSNLHTATYTLGDISNSLITGSVSQIIIKASSTKSGNKAYCYKSTDSNATTVTLTVNATYTDPGAPTGVTLNGTAGNVNVLSGSTTTLAWSGATAGTLNPITGYLVYKNGSLYKTIESASTTSTTVDTPTAGNTNTYTVCTRGAHSNSSASTARSVYAYNALNAPSAVKLNGTTGDIYVTAGTTVTLSWTAPSAATGNNLTGYQVFKDGTAYGNATTNTSMVVPAPSAGNGIAYKVRANGAYANSGYSDTRTVYVYSAPSAPSTVTLNGTAGNLNVPTGTSLTLAWSGASGGSYNAITGFIVYRNGTSFKTIETTATSGSVAVDCPSAGNTYAYTVSTRGARSNSGQSVARSVYAYAAPNAPSSVKLNGTTGDIHTVAGSAITLSWSAPSAVASNPITGYRVYKDGVAYGSVTTNTSMSVPCPTAGNSISYKVVSIGTYSNSGYSDTRTVYAFSNPTPPNTVKLNDTAGDIHVLTGTQVTLSWDGGADGSGNPFVGYQVYKGSSAFGSVTTNKSMVVDTPSANSSLVYTVVRKGTYSNSSASIARTVYGYSTPRAPTNVTVNGASSTVIDIGDAASLTWSGQQSAGEGNPTTGYAIMRASSATGTYSEFATTESTTYAVPCPPNMGESYFYKVKVKGTYADSGLSEVYVTVTAKVYSSVSAPTSVSVNPVVIAASGDATLSWSGAVGGTNTSVVGYKVYRDTSVSGDFSTEVASVTGESAIVTASASLGGVFYFKVKAISSKSGFDSELSTAYASLSVPSAPLEPIITGGESGKLYCPRPRILAKVPPNALEGVVQAISATGWTTTRMNTTSGDRVVLRRNTAYSIDTTETIAVTNTDAYGGQASELIVVEYEAPVWTDDPIEAGTTVIKAAHMNELRDCLDDILDWYGMDAHEWSEPIVAGVTSSVRWSAHAEEIKQVIISVRDKINAWDGTNSALDITLPSIPVGYVPSADIINQLRNAITLL